MHVHMCVLCSYMCRIDVVNFKRVELSSDLVAKAICKM